MLLLLLLLPALLSAPYAGGASLLDCAKALRSKRACAIATYGTSIVPIFEECLGRSWCDGGIANADGEREYGLTIVVPWIIYRHLPQACCGKNKAPSLVSSSRL